MGLGTTTLRSHSRYLQIASQARLSLVGWPRGVRFGVSLRAADRGPVAWLAEIAGSGPRCLLYVGVHDIVQVHLDVVGAAHLCGLAALLLDCGIACLAISGGLPY